MKYLLVTLLTFILSNSAFAQSDTLVLQQPSFEQEPTVGLHTEQAINGWTDCSVRMFPNESAADIHPAGLWGVTVPAQHGESYLGLVTRANETYESVSQELQSTLQAGKCYSISVHLAKSKQFTSGASTAKPDENVDFTKPIVLQVWGGMHHCDRLELLATTGAVDHAKWRQYELILRPEQDLSSITISAYWQLPTAFPYFGHILIDNISPIVSQDCGKR